MNGSQDDPLKFKPSQKKCDLSDTECSIGARPTGLTISETADLLEFPTTISGVYRVV